MHGLLVVDKPIGPTSHDVVERVRRATGERRIGHTGTLDPRASGVLPLVLGRATRLARFLAAADKSYTAVIRLGVATDTCDGDGRPVGEPYTGPAPDRAAIEQALEGFQGTFFQQPPAFSAKKVSGVRSYRTAREQRAAGSGAGPAATLSAVEVTLFELQLIDVSDFRVELALTCSAGFYVRTLAHDLGERLGCGGHLAELRRTRSGDLPLTRATPLEHIERDPGAAESALIPPARMLTSLPAATLTGEGVRRARHGRTLGDADISMRTAAEGTVTRLLDPTGDLVGIAESCGPGLLHPVVILV
jgi:tRNA pseudouridine55 synthase